MPRAKFGCLSVTSTIKATQLGKAVAYGAEITQKPFNISLPRKASWMPSGASLSSFNVSFVSAGISGVPVTGLPRSARMVLQHVSTNSLAVPISNAGSDSMDCSMRLI